MGLTYKLRVLFDDRRGVKAVRRSALSDLVARRIVSFMRNALNDAEDASGAREARTSAVNLVRRLTRLVPYSVRRFGDLLLGWISVQMRYRCEIPERYFLRTRTPRFYDIKALIPADSEDHFAFCYGPIWTRPTPYWVHGAGVSKLVRDK